MHCNPRLLGAWADGALHGLPAWRVGRHLAHCSTCQNELVALKTLNTALKNVSPLPLRQPIRRPIGLIRPVFATLALACVPGFLMLHASESELPGQASDPPRVSLVQRAVPEKGTRKVASEHLRSTQGTPPAETRRPRRRIARHQSRLKPEPEQVIVVATTLPPPKPVTVVLDDKDDEGGTIHIESTIPAAYVVALQKETK